MATIAETEPREAGGKRLVGVHLDEVEYERLSTLAATSERSRAACLRLALRRFLADETETATS
jgi:predicted transcriptional regulator